MQLLRRIIPKPRRLFYTVLRLDLPVITVWTVALLISYLSERQSNPVLAGYTYPAMLEYIIGSVVLMLASALLADVAERDTTENKR